MTLLRRCYKTKAELYVDIKLILARKNRQIARNFAIISITVIEILSGVRVYNKQRSYGIRFMLKLSQYRAVSFTLMPGDIFIFAIISHVTLFIFQTASK